MRTSFFSILSILMVSCSGNDSTEDSTVEFDDKYLPGKEVYDGACIACHMEDGKGLEETFPPLAGSDYLLDDPKRALNQVINGMDGEITVNGKPYNGVMPPQQVTDEEAVQVVNFILNAWGNDGGEVNLADIEK